MFDTLLQLPLFQGMTLEDLTHIVGKTKMHFEKYKAQEIIELAGEPCQRFTFVLNGEVEVITTSPDGSYSFTEYYEAPYLIEPQSMFGLTPNYASTTKAVRTVSTVCIDKLTVMKQLFNYEIFRLNYQNIISVRAQHLQRRLWIEPEEGIKRRMVQFFQMHIERMSGRKLVKIKMDTMALILNETRLSVSKALNQMQDSGRLVLRRGEVEIPDAAQLLSILTQEEF